MAHLLYDAHCGFCQRMLSRYGRLLRRDVRARPLQHFVSADPRLQQRQLEQAITLVLDNGQVFSGAEAIARAVGGPALLYFTPGVRQLADYAYARVARNRHRMPDGCTTHSCDPN